MFTFLRKNPRSPPLILSLCSLPSTSPSLATRRPKLSDGDALAAAYCEQLLFDLSFPQRPPGPRFANRLLRFACFRRTPRTPSYFFSPRTPTPRARDSFIVSQAPGGRSNVHYMRPHAARFSYNNGTGGRE